MSRLTQLMGQTVTKKRNAIVALLMIIPIPTISVIFSMNVAQGNIGNVVWFLSKILMISIPLWWCFKIDGDRPKFSIPDKEGMKFGILSGLGMSLVLFLAWLIIGRDYLDYSQIKDTFSSTGLTDPLIYFGVAAYWILMNSVLEEYVFRWFIFEQFEKIKSGNIAVVFSALAFTLHHTVAMSFMFPVWINILASIGIFVGGGIWSWLYLRYRSIWVPYISHMFVDVALFAVGGLILLR